MTDNNWKLKDSAELTADNVAKIACALKSLSAYTTLACAEEDSPEDLEDLVKEGMDAIEKIFED